jgi:DNA-directed RNA polymerase specialized sigma24 family protein
MTDKTSQRPKPRPVLTAPAPLEIETHSERVARGRKKIRQLYDDPGTVEKITRDQAVQTRGPRLVFNPRARRFQINLSLEHPIGSAVSSGAIKAQTTEAVPDNPTVAWLKTITTNAHRDEQRKRQVADHREGTEYQEDGPVHEEEAHEDAPLPTDHTGREPSSGVPSYRGGYRGEHRLTNHEVRVRQTSWLEASCLAAGVPRPRMRNLLLHHAGLTAREIAVKAGRSSPHFATVARWLKEDENKLKDYFRRQDK